MGAQSLDFKEFLSAYQKKSSRALDAEQAYSRAENQLQSQTDLWQSRFTATPQIEFLDRSFSAAPDVGFRAQDISATFTQSMPTGTNIELSGQKFIEVQNPLVSSVDRRYSARITQDLFRNAFGRTQRAQQNRALTDFELAQLQLRQARVESCNEAFELYTETYIQQEIAQLMQTQLKDAEEALSIARRLHRDRLVNEIDKLSSESDFLNTQLQTQQALQRLENNRRQIQAFIDHPIPADFKLTDPRVFLTRLRGVPENRPTLNELLIQHRLESQEFEVERARTDRWADVRLGLEAGETVGRFGFTGTLLDFNDVFLRATLTVGLDLINRTEDAELKNAIQIKNNFAKQKLVTEKTQKSLVENLKALNRLLQAQVVTSEKQVQLLKEKAKVAFEQMGRARLDFENYLLHRNAYLDRKINDLNLKKDYWLNQFSLQREYAHESPEFCEVRS
jgi:outer membrane protein TolC